MWTDWLKGLIGKSPESANNARPTGQAQASPPSEWQSLVRCWNGYNREAGLKAIRSSRSPQRLEAIIERLNDWVPEVRAAASVAFEDYLIPQHADWLLAQLPAVLALENRRRANHGPTISRLEAVLAKSDYLNQCEEIFWLSRGACARLLFNVLTQHKVESALEAFLISALHHLDFGVRRMALSKAMELPETSAQKAIAFGLTSASGILRTQSFHMAIRFPEGRTNLITHALTDPSPSVRSAALWAAKQHGVDPSQILQDRLTGQIPTKKVYWLGVLGLAQRLGARLPESWLTAGMNQSSGAVRSLILAIAGSDKPHLLFAAIGDPSRDVFEIVAKGLRELPWNAIEHELTDRLEAAWERLSLSRSHAFLKLMPRWAQAGFLLQRLHQNANEAYWLEQIRWWVNTQPNVVADPATSKDERQRIIQQLTELETARALPVGSVGRLI